LNGLEYLIVEGICDIRHKPEFIQPFRKSQYLSASVNPAFT
jgi:hypothetical protein